MDYSRANVLLIMPDQERFELTAPDGPPVATPNIDRIREAGMTFTNAYTPTSICTPARASLLSGLYPHAHGLLNNTHEPDAVQPNFPPDIPTLGELVDDAGYNCTYAGKWHVGRDQLPKDFGFEYVGGGDGDPADAAAFRKFQRSHGVEPDEIDLIDPIYTDTADPVLVAATTPIPPEATRTVYLADRTIKAIKEHAERDEPFFHRLDFPGPHFPYTVPEPYASMYDPDEIDPWGSFVDTYDGKPAVQEQYLEYRGVSDWTWDDWKDAVAKYFGFVTFIDEQIGRVLDALDTYVDSDTVVIHTADHGDFAGGHRQFNKGPLMYEDTYQIPLHVHWPDVTEPRSTCDAFVSLFDLMPTIVELAGAEVPPNIHARSLRPLLEGERPDDWPATLFAEYHGDEFGLYTQRMVRSERFKYVFNPPDTDELYDLERDPHELHNLIDHPDYADVLATHRDHLLTWMVHTDDTIRKWSRGVLETKLGEQ